MKKIYLALMCMASLAILTACGGGGSQAKSEEEKVVEKLEAAFETGVFGERTKKAAQEAYKGIDLTVGDVEPGFAYLEVDTVKTYRGVVYRGNFEASTVFIKQDMTDVTRDEFDAYVRKIYGVTQGIADNGKVIYGFERRDVLEEAEAEWAVEDILAQTILGFPLSSYDWGFKKEGKFWRMSVELLSANKKYPARLEVHFYAALQKSMSDTMKEAEKALEDPEVQKALEDFGKK